MKEPVEEKLVNKIRQVFDEFEDNSADFGWEKFREQYPEKHRKPLFAWLSSAAAILLALSGLWYFTANKTAEKIADQKTKQHHLENDTQASNKFTVIEKEAISTEKNPRPDSENNYTATKPNKSLHKKVSVSLQKPLPITNHLLLSNNELKADTASENQSNSQLLENVSSEDQQPASIAKKDVEPLIEITPSFEKEVKTARHSPKLLSTLAENEPKEINKKSNKKVAFSLYAGTYMNYAKGSENNLNMGVGLTSDIELAKNLNLSTGLAIAKNTLKFTDELPATATETFYRGAATDLVQALNGASAMRIPSSQLDDFNANLLTLDLPINIKYQLTLPKNNLYVLAGLSSGTYLTEAYTYTYKEYSSNLSNNSKNRSTSQSFNDFDFARTLNVSLGFSTDLSKTQNFTIEPFLKYPLGGLGSQDIRFGSAGINLKLNFKPSKK